MTESVPAGAFWESSRFRRWLDRRLPAANAVTLDQKKIFILPTREGMYFVGVILFILVAGINYQNSLVLAAAFLLLSLFMVCIFHTYRNLSGLTLIAGATRHAFAGEDAEFQVILQRNGKRTYEGLHLGWNPALLKVVDLIEEEEQRVRLYVQSKRRGNLDPGRMLIQTFYPVGLFRAWSWVDLNMSTLVYPKPVQAGDLPPSFSPSDDGELVQREGADDFYGMREYQAGDSLRHIAWKSYARNEKLMVKQFSSFVDRRMWLEWDHFTGMDRESRLSRLCFWVLKYSKTPNEYGLRLPGIEVAPSRGDHHRDEMLKLLALFELEENPA